MTRIGLEAGPLSQWLYAGMREAGLSVELLETRHVRDAFKAMPVKTDCKDARGVAQLMRLGWFRPVHCKSLPAQRPGDGTLLRVVGVGSTRTCNLLLLAGWDRSRFVCEEFRAVGQHAVQIRLIERFAGCFIDHGAADLVVHEVSALVGQRVFGIALGYEDLIDHDQLRHEPVMAMLGGKLEGGRAARRQIDAQPAGVEPATADPLSQEWL